MKTKKTYSVYTIFLILASLLLFTAQWVQAFTSVSAQIASDALSLDPTAVMFDTRTVDEHNGCNPPWWTAPVCPGAATHARTPMWTVNGENRLPISVPYWNLASTRNTGPPEDVAEVRSIIGKLLEAGVIDFNTPIYLICRTAYRSYYMSEWMDTTTFAPGSGLDTDPGAAAFTNLINVDADGTPGGGLGGMQEWIVSGLSLYNNAGQASDYYVPPQVFSITPADGYLETNTQNVIFTVNVLEPTTGGSFSYPAVTRVSLNINGSEADFYTTGTTGLWTDYPLSYTLTNNTYIWNSSAVSSAGTSWSPHALASGLDDRSLTVSVGPEIDVTDSISPSNDLGMSFGTVSVGNPSAETVTIANTGDNLSISSIQLTGTDASQFSFDAASCGSSTPYTVASGNNCTVTVTFDPQSGGAKTASLQIDSNDFDEAQVDVALSGTGSTVAVPNIDVIPTSIVFGTIDTTSDQTVTVTNNGNAELSIGSIALSNSLIAPFSILNDNCSGQTVIPAASCTFVVRFSPTAAVTSNDTFDIPSDDPDESSLTVSASGTGTTATVPDITVTDSAAPNNDLNIPFGSVTVSTTSNQTVTVTNNGSANLSIGTIAMANPLAAPFSILNNACSGQTLTPAANCTFDVRFSPTTTGAFNDTLDIPSDDPDEDSATVNVNGTGAAATVPDITVTDSAAPNNDLNIPFGNAAVTTMSEQTVTVTNDGSADLSIGSIAQANSLAAPFSIVNDNCSNQTLTPASNCTFVVRFSPTAAVTLNDSFDMPSDDPDENPVTVNVSGTGAVVTVPDITVTDSAAPNDDLNIPFGNVTEETTSNQTVTVTNNGSADLSIGSIAQANALAAPFSILNDNCSGQILLSAENCTFDVRFSPTAAVTLNDSFDIPSDDPDEDPITVNVSGTGAVATLPDITVNDSVAPNNDLNIPFGNVTVNTTWNQTVTVTNYGSADLSIGSIAQANALAAPFSIFNDTCSGQTLPPASNCIFDVSFSPTAAVTTNDSLDIPSDDPDEDPITVNVSGAGMVASIPDIAVTDSAYPNTDLNIPFGNVTVDATSDQTITVTNDGNANLALGNIALANSLSAPFSIFNNTCSNQILTPAATCSFDVRFSPTVAATSNDTFDIPSDDPDENTVTVSVTGVGTATSVPDITVTDSVTPSNDLQISFGNVTLNTTPSQTVTVTNDGSAGLILGTIINPLTAPFSILNDVCSNQTLTPGASCIFDILFSPTAAVTSNDSIDIPSNDTDENPVTVNVRGTGTVVTVPDITVTDSAAPNNNRQIPFGNVTVNTTSDQTVTVTNDGNVNLVLGNIALANSLAAPFSILSETCSNQTLTPGASCTFYVRFSPTAIVTSNDSLDIPSNDPDENPVTVTVSGTGTLATVSDITVTDSVDPNNDLNIPFGNLTEETTSDQTVTVTNNGSADLSIGSIALANPIAAPFSILNDTCSSQTVTLGASCTFDVRFSPTAAVTSSDTFDIPSNDPDEDPLTVNVSGTGLQSLVNNVPSQSQFVYPANGQQGLSTTVTLEWKPVTDPDGDTVTYDVYNCTNADPANNCAPVAVALQQKGSDNSTYLASLGFGGGVIIFGITLAGGIRSRKQIALLIVAVAVTSALVASCGSKDNGGQGNNEHTVDDNNKTHTVSGLSSNTTYYWTVITKDDNGGETQSDVWSFTTQ